MEADFWSACNRYFCTIPKVLWLVTAYISLSEYLASASAFAAVYCHPMSQVRKEFLSTVEAGRRMSVQYGKLRGRRSGDISE